MEQNRKPKNTPTDIVFHFDCVLELMFKTCVTFIRCLKIYNEYVLLVKIYLLEKQSDVGDYGL